MESSISCTTTTTKPLVVAPVRLEAAHLLAALRRAAPDSALKTDSPLLGKKVPDEIPITAHDLAWTGRAPAQPRTQTATEVADRKANKINSEAANSNVDATVVAARADAVVEVAEVAEVVKAAV